MKYFALKSFCTGIIYTAHQIKICRLVYYDAYSSMRNYAAAAGAILTADFIGYEYFGKRG